MPSVDSGPPSTSNRDEDGEGKGCARDNSDEKTKKCRKARLRDIEEKICGQEGGRWFQLFLLSLQ